MRSLTALALSAGVTLASVGPAAAQAASELKGSDQTRLGDGRRTLRRLPLNLGRGFSGVFHRESILPLFVGGVATGGASVLDEPLRASINPDPAAGWGQTVGTAGGAIWTGAFVSSLFAASRFSENARFRAASYDLVEATIVNAGYVQSLKLIVHRRRPNGTNRQSFPSGHASNAFALATVAERHYGWKAGVPAYLLAGLVGASRLKQDKHYFSDVMAGATLGYIVGRTTVRRNSEAMAAASPRTTVLRVSPIVAREARGLMLSVAF
ncbi:MAG: phosphatase PAP2 family protein [Vicinamibacteria bacterium]|nr:phosphatase PAP2 family protein [Vicinamibacteria bacterium]